MKEYIDDKTDVMVNHTVFRQVVYLLVALIVMGCTVYFMIKGEAPGWKRYGVAPLLSLLCLFGIYSLISVIVKERVKKIPVLMVTSHSLILSRNSREYNEIPFSVVEQFLRQRVRTGRNSVTDYLVINYKPDDGHTENERFERVDRISCNGLNMPLDKLLQLLQDRLQRYNQTEAFAQR